MGSVSSSGSRPGVLHIALHIRYAQPIGWEKKNKRTNTDLGQLQAKEREVCVSILCSFSCICRLSRACILRETTRHANSSLTVFSLCLLLLTVLPLDCYLKPTVLLCAALSIALSVFSGTFLASSISGLAGDLELSPLCGFRAKIDK